MTIAHIQRWLNSDCPFDQGRELYLQFIHSGAVRKMLEGNAAESSFLRKKIKAALQEFVHQAEEKISNSADFQTEPRTVPTRSAPAPVQKIDALNYPEELQSRIAEKKKLYQVAQEIRQRMFLEKDLHKRSELFKSLYDIKVHQIDAIWRELDFFKQTGEVISEQHKEMSLPDIIKRRNNVRTYVSRYKLIPEKQERLKEYEKELITLNELYERAIQG